MARAQVEQGKLRGCPTCGTKVDATDLKLRDFSWVNEALPGKVGGMDIDFCINQARTGRVLMLELKPPGAWLSVGAKLTFKVMKEKPLVDVWIVWGPDADGKVEVSHVRANGELTGKYSLPLEKLAEQVALWWDEGVA